MDLSIKLALNSRLNEAKKMPADCSQIESRSPRTRARVSNHAELLPGVDGRSGIARRYRDITEAILADQGGADRCSESRIQLIRRFAAAAVLAEQAEARLAKGEQIDVGEHALLCSTLVRVAQRIGINRTPKNITPSVADYVEHVAQQEAAP
jgi:hypothetical protein